MKSLSSHSWIKISLANLTIVALIGVLMRYKISHSLPWADQKNLLHAHSHFAFTGWVALALMTLMIQRLSYDHNHNYFRRYRFILIANIISAYGMLLSFPFQGYGMASISFSTLSIFVGYVFAFMFWKDLNKGPAHASNQWFKSALFFNVISSIGAFYLAYMMATKTASNERYLSSLYYYLHFQYNGWFIFGCIGLFVPWLQAAGMKLSKLRVTFWALAISCIFAYFLSAIWLPIPTWVFVLVAASAIIQCIAWVYLASEIYKLRKKITGLIDSALWWTLTLSGIAITIKFILQLGTTFPKLSQIALGFRPIIIGYLHLVLLGVVTLFLLGYGFITGAITLNKASKAGLYIFVAGIILNEFLLMVQGAASLYYFPIPYINDALLIAAATLFLGGLVLFTGNKRMKA